MNLSYNGFDTDGGKALADVIKNNSSLQELNISNTRLTAESAASIANALQVNDSLKTLIVSIKYKFGEILISICLDVK